jgi:hypothetical protein
MHRPGAALVEPAAQVLAIRRRIDPRDADKVEAQPARKLFHLRGHEPEIGLS